MPFPLNSFVKVSTSKTCMCRGLQLDDFEVGIVRYYESARRMYYTNLDPLNGEWYWLSHLRFVDLEESTRIERIELPYDSEFVVDAVSLWIENSEFDSGLVHQCFAYSAGFFWRNGFSNLPLLPINGQIDDDFGYLFSDFTANGLEFVRQSYRDWMLDSMESGAVLNIE